MSSSTQLSMRWPVITFFAFSAIFLPFYLFFTISFIRLRNRFVTTANAYQTTFYTLLLQHCIADIFSMCSFVVSYAYQVFPSLSRIYFDYQNYYVAAAAYNFIYFTLYIRCWGILILSIQRLLIITLPHVYVSRLIQESSTTSVVLFYWIVPTIISSVVLKDRQIHYTNVVQMEIVVDRSIISRNTLMALIIVSLTCFLSLTSYFCLFLYLKKNRINLSKKTKREVYLAFQVFVLLFAFFFIFIYYLLQNYFSWTSNSGIIFTMRSIYCLVNAFLSYVNPCCILIIDRDLRRKILPNQLLTASNTVKVLTKNSTSKL